MLTYMGSCCLGPNKLALLGMLLGGHLDHNSAGWLVVLGCTPRAGCDPLGSSAAWQ